MEFKNYIRKPFTVEAVEITRENIGEVAELIGEVREKDGQPFIAINRRLVPNIHRAYLGWYVTKLGDNFRCYNAKVFNSEFTEHDPGSGYFFEEKEDDPYLNDATGARVSAHNVFDESSGNYKLVITPDKPYSGDAL